MYNILVNKTETAYSFRFFQQFLNHIYYTLKLDALQVGWENTYIIATDYWNKQYLKPPSNLLDVNQTSIVLIDKKTYLPVQYVTVQDILPVLMDLLHFDQNIDYTYNAPTTESFKYVVDDNGVKYSSNSFYQILVKYTSILDNAQTIVEDKIKIIQEKGKTIIFSDTLIDYLIYLGKTVREPLLDPITNTYLVTHGIDTYFSDMSDESKTRKTFFQQLIYTTPPVLWVNQIREQRYNLFKVKEHYYFFINLVDSLHDISGVTVRVSDTDLQYVDSVSVSELVYESDPGRVFTKF